MYDLSTSQQLFDYGALDSETRIVVQQRTGEIKGLMKRAATDIIEIGQKLIEVKARLGHGNFGGWLASEFQWTPQLARQFMNVAETFCETENETLFRFGSSALRLLAAPSTPEAARLEALGRAADGENITNQLARDIVSNHLNPAIPFVPEEEDEPLTPYEEQIAARYIAQQEAAREVRAIQAEPPVAAVHAAAASVEWYTPQRYIDAARLTMGNIDTDPASNETAQRHINAATYYTEDTNGFDKPWRGRVWLNPPYGVQNGKAVAGRWAERLIEQYNAGITTEAILLVNAVIDSKWFNILWQFPMCLTDHRIRFDLPANAPEDANTSPIIGSAIVYLGANVTTFVQHFSQFGAVVSRLSTYDNQVFTELELAHGSR